MKQPTLKLSKLKKEGLIGNTPVESTNKKRLLQMKFYFDNTERNQTNMLATFEVKSPEHAIRVLTKFESEGAKIRACFLNPNDETLSKKMGIRFEFKSHPLYKYFKGEN